MKHTGDKAPSNVVGFLERVLVRSKINDDKQPRFLVGWALGHKDADIVALMEDGSVRYIGSRTCSPERRSDPNDWKDERHKTGRARLFGMRTWNQLVDGAVRRRWQSVETSWA